jgi:hypothetical protein
MRHPHFTSLKKFDAKIRIVPNFARRVREEFNQASAPTAASDVALSSKIFISIHGARDKSLGGVDRQSCGVTDD